MAKAKNERREGDYIANLMNEGDPRKQHYFLDYHPGKLYAYLKRREHIIIPKISIEEACCVTSVIWR